MVSRVFRERELQWIHAAAEAFEAAQRTLAAAPAAADDDADRRALVEARIDGLSELAHIGDHFLRTILEQGSVDVLPIKALGDLARIIDGGGQKK
jgi:hypothetical protein